MGRFRIGHFDKKIIIERSVDSIDSVGQPIRSWSTFKTVFAAIRPLKARERFRADRFVFEDIQVFVIRWIVGLRPLMRIAYDDGNGTRYFNIRNIAEYEDNRRRFLEITAEAQD